MTFYGSLNPLLPLDALNNENGEQCRNSAPKRLCLQPLYSRLSTAEPLAMIESRRMQVGLKGAAKSPALLRPDTVSTPLRVDERPGTLLTPI